MKLTTENLNKYINLYINDVEDYGDETEAMLTESALNPLKKLLTESKNKNIDLLGESYKTSPQYKKDVIDDLILYIKNI
tara:strand:- start:1160 stop:1396 length:237 start_codon:yes stop_codon:yes gene_type:complete